MKKNAHFLCTVNRIKASTNKASYTLCQLKFAFYPSYAIEIFMLFAIIAVLTEVEIVKGLTQQPNRLHN